MSSQSKKRFDSKEYKFLRHENCPKCGSIDNVGVWLHLESNKETKYCNTPNCGFMVSTVEAIGSRVQQPGAFPSEDRVYFNSDICKKYRITADGNIIYFGYATPDGKLKRYKIRDYNYPKYHEKHFRWDRAGTCDLLYGMDACTPGDEIILTFGEKDAAAAHAMTGMNAVSLPNGDGSVEVIKENYRFLMNYKTIFICADNDESGAAGAEKAKALLGYRGKIVVLPPLSITLEDNETVTFKDTFDFFKYKFDGEFKRCIERARTAADDYSYSEDDLVGMMEEYLTSTDSVPIYTGIQEVDRLCPFYRHQFTLLYGSPGKGKSTLARSFLRSISDQGVRSYYISFEESPQEVMLRLIPVMLNEPVNFDADGKIANSVKDMLDKTRRMHSLVDVAKIGDTSCATLASVIEYAYAAKGCEFVVLDHLTWMADTSDDPILATRLLMHTIADAVKRYPIHILVVAHNKRANEPPRMGGNKTPPSDWEERQAPTQRDALYGSGLEQTAFNIWGLKHPNDSPMRLYILKNRKRGKKGCGMVYLHWNETNYTFMGGTENGRQRESGLRQYTGSDNQVRISTGEGSTGEVLPPGTEVRQDNHPVSTQEEQQQLYRTDRADTPEEAGGDDGGHTLAHEISNQEGVASRFRDKEWDNNRDKGGDAGWFRRTGKGFQGAASGIIQQLQDSVPESKFSPSRGRGQTKE